MVCGFDDEPTLTEPKLKLEGKIEKLDENHTSFKNHTLFNCGDVLDTPPITHMVPLKTSEVCPYLGDQIVDEVI